MPTQYEQRILRVLQYIYENPAGDLSLDALAEVAAMSRFHWHRVFHAMTGETCAQTVRRIRMLKAAKLLLSKDWAIEKIAVRVGYPNLQSFTRAFGDCYGVSPGSFRESDWQLEPPRPKSKGEFKMFTVEVNDVPTCRLAALTHHGAYSNMGPCFQKLFGLATSSGLWPHVKGVASVYYDDPNFVAADDLKAHAGLVIGADAVLDTALEDVSLVGGRFAVLHYKGPYAAMGAAYDHLYGNWLPNSGQEPRDAPCYELYQNSPTDTKPDDLLTDIYLPLES